MDELFSQGLDGLELKPSPTAWAGIREKMGSEKFDGVVREKLSKMEVQPSADVWARIKNQLPYHLFLRRGLTQFSFVAACLLLGIASFLVFDYFQPISLLRVPSLDLPATDASANANAAAASRTDNENLVMALDAQWDKEIENLYQSADARVAAALAAIRNDAENNTASLDQIYALVPDYKSAASGGPTERLVPLTELLANGISPDEIRINEVWLVSGVNTDQIRPGTGANNYKPKKFYVQGFAQVQQPWFLSQSMRQSVGADATYQFTPGFSFGGAIGHRFNSQIGVQAELMAGWQGQNYRAGTDGNAQLRTEYLYLPVMVRYQPKASALGKIDLSYLAGPQYGFQMGAQLNGDALAPAERSHTIRHEIGLVVGVDATLPLSERWGLLFGARASAGSDFSKKNAMNANYGLRFGMTYQVGKATP